MKKHWGRLVWVTITNVPIFVFSIYMLIGIHQEEIRITEYPPPPRFWTVFYDNPHFALALGLTGVGLLLEAANRREAGFVISSFWLLLSIYAVVNGWPAISTAVVVVVLVVNLAWYLVPARREAEARQLSKTPE